MCCEPRSHHSWHGHPDLGCCCAPGAGHHFRRYVSKREQIERLEAYREALQKELSGVDEAIEELKAK
jgi:hypothetical protein